jgi:hypothetical protein
MPYSYTLFKDEVKVHFLNFISKGISILDVGAGCGTYSDLLRGDFPNMDALEIFTPYIEQFNLRAKYNNVIVGDITDFDISKYEYLIMGDVLEHLSVSDAQSIINKIQANDILSLVAVPYNYEQGTYMGNVHETHLQPDLTPELVAERYPSLKLLIGDDKYGYYVNYDFR